jgi:hypothetical protein
VNHTAIKKHLAAVLLGVSVIVTPGYVLAQSATDECTKELLLSYFPESFVKNTLQKFNVPKDKWDGVIKALADKDKDVLKIVEDKASKLNPNPFKDRDPAQRQVAVKIFRETLFQVFSDALKSQDIENTQYQAMLDDIQQQKAKNFAQCMEKQKSQIPGGQSMQQAAPAGDRPINAVPESSSATQPQDMHSSDSEFPSEDALDQNPG